MQAACGLAQLDRVDGFIQSRKDNFNYLTNKLQSVTDYLTLPQATENSDPSWFGFPITIKSNAGTDRITLLKYLNQNNIGTRLLFAGNITKQPYFNDIEYRIVSELENTNIIMNNTFWIGVFPGITEEMMDFVVEKIELYFGIGF